MDWKKAGRRLLYPPIWLMLILVLISAGALVAVFSEGAEQTLVAYGAYALSFYTLCVVTLFFVMVFPGKLNGFKQWIWAKPLGKRFAQDRVFRTKVSLYVSLFINTLYVGINLWSWHMLRSWWFVVLAVYYSILAVMRFLLVRYARTNPLGTKLQGEWKRARSCAYILLLINLFLSAAVLMILYQSKGYDYPGILIYVMALYTFYSLIHAIVNMVKYRALGSPVLSAAKVVSLSAALVSMLNLETAMFAQFGAAMAQEDQNLMIILTGAGISVTVVSLSVILIVHATKEIRREKDGE